MFLEKLLILLLNKKKYFIFFIFFSFFIIGCSNFSFVYSDKYEFDEFLKETTIQVDGDSSAIIKILLTPSYLDGERKIKYLLDIKSKKESKNLVIENDKTASVVEIKFNLEYIFKNNLKGCIIFQKDVETTSTYNSRAEGYNFGTDLIEEQTSRQLIEDNIALFLQYLKTNNNDNFICQNES